MSHIGCLEGSEAEVRANSTKAVAAFEWPAASIDPTKLTHWLLDKFVQQGGRLYTHCQVTDIQKPELGDMDDEGAVDLCWKVLTTRGSIIAWDIVHCTNAYASYVSPIAETFE